MLLLTNKQYRAQASERTNAKICRKWYYVPHLFQGSLTPIKTCMITLIHLTSILKKIQAVYGTFQVSWTPECLTVPENFSENLYILRLGVS